MRHGSKEGGSSFEDDSFHHRPGSEQLDDSLDHSRLSHYQEAKGYHVL
jgi:hypothetical protein